MGADGDGLAGGHGADGGAVAGVSVVGIVAGIVVVVVVVVVVAVPPVLAVVVSVSFDISIAVSVPVVGVVVTSANAQAVEKARDKVPLLGAWPVDRRGLHCVRMYSKRCCGMNDERTWANVSDATTNNVEGFMVKEDGVE